MIIIRSILAGAHTAGSFGILPMGYLYPSHLCSTGTKLLLWELVTRGILAPRAPPAGIADAQICNPANLSYYCHFLFI